jgi:hypothetical protein
MAWLGRRLGKLCCGEVKKISAKDKLRLMINKFVKKPLQSLKQGANLNIGTKRKHLVNQPNVPDKSHVPPALVLAQHWITAKTLLLRCK